MPLFATRRRHRQRRHARRIAKPHPAPLLEAARQLGVRAGRSASTWATTSATSLAGRAAGMRTVAATYGYLGERRPTPTAGKRDARIDSPLALLALLKYSRAGLKYESWGCTGFDVGSESQRGMSS